MKNLVKNEIEAVGGVGGGSLACLAVILLSQYSKQSNIRIFLRPDRCKGVALYKPAWKVGPFRTFWKSNYVQKDKQKWTGGGGERLKIARMLILESAQCAKIDAFVWWDGWSGLRFTIAFCFHMTSLWKLPVHIHNPSLTLTIGEAIRKKRGFAISNMLVQRA